MRERERYEIIIQSICDNKGFNKEQLIKLLKKREYIYLLLLFSSKYQCTETNEMKENLKKMKINHSDISNELKMAEKKFLLNKYFRYTYFQIEDIIEQKMRNIK